MVWFYVKLFDSLFWKVYRLLEVTSNFTKTKLPSAIVNVGILALLNAQVNTPFIPNDARTNKRLTDHTTYCSHTVKMLHEVFKIQAE